MFLGRRFQFPNRKSRGRLHLFTETQDATTTISMLHPSLCEIRRLLASNGSTGSSHIDIPTGFVRLHGQWQNIAAGHESVSAGRMR